MSRLAELIQQYCPNGVEFVQIGQIAQVGTGSSNGNEADEDGIFPFFVRSQTVKRKNDYEYDEEAIIIPGEGGIGDIFHYINGKYALHQRVYRIHFTTPSINTKFAFYYLKSAFKQFILMKAVSATVVSIRKPMIEGFPIPVPPLPVQEEIVRILDNFTNLAAELQAELQARRKQYQYYRDTLLSFEGRTDVEWKKLGEIATLIRGGNFQKKDFTDSGVPCIHYGQIYTHFGIHTTSTLKYISPDVASKSKIAKTNDIVMAITSENVEDVGKCVAWMGDEDIAVSGHTAIIQHKQNAKYLSYYFHSSHFFTQKKRLAHGTKVIEISPKDLANVVIPIPPLAEQQRIVDILDRFHALTTDITAGLPAEIEARRKQYEYYRDQLLTFKQKA